MVVRAYKPQNDAFGSDIYQCIQALRVIAGGTCRFHSSVRYAQLRSSIMRAQCSTRTGTLYLRSPGDPESR
jgi:hypothetical protein